MFIQARSQRGAEQRVTHSLSLSDLLCPVGEKKEGRVGRGRTDTGVENPWDRLKPKADHKHRPGEEPRNKVLLAGTGWLRQKGCTG